MTEFLGKLTLLTNY